MKVDSPLRVQVPAPADDRTSWARVGVIALVGFVIGVGWPRLVGARIGPSLPADTTPSAVAARAESPGATAVSARPAGSPPAPSSTSSAAGGAPPVANAALPAVTVNHGVLLTCRDEDGQTLRGVGACGGLSGFDAIVQPRLRKLGSCPAATAATSGKLSVVFNLDFASHRVAAEVGKSSTVADNEGFTTCVKGAFQGVSLGALEHQNPRYTIAYSVVFAPTGTAPAPADRPSSAGPADGVPVATVTERPTARPSASDEGSAEVAWDVAIVRETPHTGAAVARLPRGTKVRVETSQDGWYKVAFTTPSTGEGWVYRGAIAR